MGTMMKRQLHLHQASPGIAGQRIPFVAAPPGAALPSGPTRVAVPRRMTPMSAVRADASASDTSSSASNAKVKRGSRSTYRPDSYKELITDAVEAVKAGLDAGLTRMEVEFPAAANVDGYNGASDFFIDANVQLAVSAARELYAGTGKRTHILLPDETEYLRAAKLFKSTLELSEGVTLGHMREGKRGVLSGIAWLFLAGTAADPAMAPDPTLGSTSADLFLAVNASTIELADLETYVNEKVGPSRPLVTWNMELDTLRADLGLLGFPPKDLQYRFLSSFKPVFYIRQRDYSKTVAVAPFIINYSGALFREFPGPWQVMLRQDNGVYACVAENEARRYNLGQFKAELTKAMGLDTEEAGSTMSFLRSGYKTSTWWEDDEDKELSPGWRT